MLRAADSIKIKNLNGAANIESGSDVLIDGADGEMSAVSGGVIDVHLDSSFKKGTLKSTEKIIIRTPPDQNEHTFLIKPNCSFQIDGFTGYEKHEGPTGTVIALSGTNTAGHPRKVMLVDFGGAIELDAPSVIIRAESWLQKQMSQKKRFPKKATEVSSQYRFY